jgi:hypothetical protein
MEHDRIAALIAAYLDGRAELEPTVAALVEAWREEGWGLYLDPEQAAPAQRERARRLWAEYGRRLDAEQPGGAGPPGRAT